MTVLDLFVSATLAQVTLITAAALIVIWCGRRQAAFRHAAGVVGLLLVVGSPLLVLALPKPAWLALANSSRESTLPVTEQAGLPHSSDVRENREFTEKAGVDMAHLPAREPVAVARRVPQPIDLPVAVDDAAAIPPVVEAPVIVESVSATATPPLAAAREPRDPVPARSADDVTVRWRDRRLTTLIRILSAVWCLGILVAAVRDSRRRRALRTISRTTSDADLERVTRAAQDVRATLGMSELPRIRVSDLIPLPFVLGVRKPFVVLPSDILASASNGRLRDILIHECAHIVRKDCWVHFLQRIAAIVFWFHPGVLRLNAQIGRAREELCDNFVLMAGDPAEYAETLLELTETCGDKRLCLSAPGLSPLGLFSARWTLEQRVAGLLDPRRDRTMRTWPGALIMLTILFSSLSLLVGGVGLITQRAAANATTDAGAADKADTVAAAKEDKAETPVPSGRKITIRGKCVDDDGKPVANATVRVLQDGFPIATVANTAPDPVSVVAEVKSDAKGEFVFNDIVTPAIDPRPQHQKMLHIVAIAAGRASAVAQTWGLDEAADELIIGESKDPEEHFILSKDRQTVSGVVTDPAGRPVAGARVFMGTGFGNPFPGMWSAVTDRAGKYSIGDLERWKETVVEQTDQHGTTTMTTRNTAAVFNAMIRAEHPQYAITTETVGEVPKTVDIKLKPAAIVEGKVVDRVTGKPAAAVTVFARGIGRDEFAVATTDAKGRYRFRLLKDHYNIWGEAEDRIAAVQKAVPAVPGKPVANADFQLVRGGFVVGTVIDDATNQPLAGSKDKNYIVAHYGPACVRFTQMLRAIGNPEWSIGVQQETRVSPDGTFRLRVAPGRNGVFFIENFGDTEQSPQIVTIADGEEKKVELRVTLRAGEVSSEGQAIWKDDEIDADRDQFLQIRRDVAIEDAQARAIAGKPDKGPPLTKVPSRERPDSAVNRLLDKFERQSIGQDHFRDPWLRTIKDIVDLGPAAVPDLIEELDATEDRWMLQLLGFTVRAIGDRRAIPALIRAIPRTSPLPEPANKSFTAEEWQMYRHPPTGNLLNAVDPELRTFAQANQLSQYLRESKDDDEDQPSRYDYHYERPAKEICGALTKLTRARNGEEELFEVEKYSLTSPDQILARQQLFDRVSNDWSLWWREHENDKFVVTPVSPEELQAIEALLRRGASVIRDGTWPGSPVTRVGFDDNYNNKKKTATDDDLKLLKVFPSLRVLRMPISVDPPPGGMKIIGELRSLTELHLGSNRGGRSIVGSGLKELRGLPQLQVLTLGIISDDDLKEIGQLKRLRKLRFFGPSISEVGMQALKGLDHLEDLHGGGWTITDAGVANLAALTSLKKLDLSYNEITDASLKELKRLENLESLDLSNTQIKGIGIGEFKDLRRLTTLKLSATRVGDAAANQIAEIKSLKALYLTNTKITDDALKQFEHLPDLGYLDVKETEVTSEATRALKKSLPELQISE